MLYPSGKSSFTNDFGGENGNSPDGKTQDDRQETSDLYHFYFQEITRYPLLNANAEEELGCIILEGRKLLQICEDCGIIPPENLENLVNEAREIMITSNLKLVISIALKYHEPRIQPLDFIQLGNIGLIKAVDSFDYRKGTKFSTYATDKIRQPMLYEFHKAKTIKVSSRMDGLIKEIKKFVQEFSNANRELPSNDEIADGLDYSIVLVQECLEIMSWSYQPLNANPGSADDDLQLENALPNDDLSPEDNAYFAHRRQKIENALSHLPKQFRRVLESRFGLFGKEATLDKIGKKIGRTQERVRQMENKALAYLKQPLREEELQQFFDEL